MSQLRRLVRKSHRADPLRASLARLADLERDGVLTSADVVIAADHVRAGADVATAILALGDARVDAAIARTRRVLPDLARDVDALTPQLHALLAARA